jgi:hypothetical protein
MNINHVFNADWWYHIEIEYDYIAKTWKSWVDGVANN